MQLRPPAATVRLLCSSQRASFITCNLHLLSREQPSTRPPIRSLSVVSTCWSAKWPRRGVTSHGVWRQNGAWLLTTWRLRHWSQFNQWTHRARAILSPEAWRLVTSLSHGTVCQSTKQVYRQWLCRCPDAPMTSRHAEMELHRVHEKTITLYTLP